MYAKVKARSFKSFGAIKHLPVMHKIKGLCYPGHIPF